MSNLLGGEQSMLEKLMAAQERIAELEAAALEIRADCNAVVCGKSDRITELEASLAAAVAGKEAAERALAQVEKIAEEERAQEKQNNSQFGVGA